MRIGENREEGLCISFAAMQNRQAAEGNQKQGSGRAGSVHFNGMNQAQSTVWQKKALAQKQARKLVADVFTADGKVTEGMRELRGRISEWKAESAKAAERIAAVEDQKAEWKEAYHVADDSEEQQELLLLEKRQASLVRGSGVVLTLEEQEQLSQIDQKGLTEYQRRCLEENADAVNCRSVIDTNRLKIIGANASIRDTKLEKLKHRYMGEAQDLADELMQAASREAADGLLAEAKQHVDEKQEEEKEKADERREEEEEKEETLENRREQSAEQEARINSLREHISAREKETEIRREQAAEQRDQYRDGQEQSRKFVEIDGKKETVQEDVRQMLKELGLLDEDIKGASVDELL